MAAKPNEPPMLVLKNGTLDPAIARDDPPLSRP